ncbi:MAG: hypothetical protein Q4G48_03125 [Bacteroidia bacterium]|nr:hypothetical protein [Bacteroidia bacterium]
MKVIAHINIDTAEGREIVEWLRRFPEDVVFEDNTLNEPETLYETEQKVKSIPTHLNDNLPDDFKRGITKEELLVGVRAGIKEMFERKLGK